jgi:hypothetical protein
MKKIIISLLVGLMLLMVGCDEIENTPEIGTDYTEIMASEISPPKKTIEEMSNIEKVEYYIQKADDFVWRNDHYHGEYYLNLAKLYMLKEAVENGTVIDSSALLADKEIKI